ncbi:MAG: 4'-phosphopantetheinyl transferase superfamily protein [Halioglobus sp.]|nr:4'-phosphopantetheinyl transferase superfamily protein [Halioglobus sp.]
MTIPLTGQLELPETGIHLWRTRPQDCVDSALLARYHAVLTDEEKAKQQRYIFEKDRHCALVTRAFVRDVLSSYAAVEPADWRMEIGPTGKPELVDPPVPLRFNLSHTPGLIICAVTPVYDIGCDVESLARRSDILGIADHYFSPQEVEELFSLPSEQQRSRFFDYWTLKESYIKARGLGLFALPLQGFSFDVGRAASSSVNDNIRLSFAAGIDGDPALWSSWIFYPSEEHRIALSIRSDPRTGRGPLAAGDYSIRHFESIPLSCKRELECSPQSR